MIEFKGNYWYKITYIDRRQEVVQFLGTSEDGQRLKFRLCNGEDVTETVLNNKLSVRELGRDSPC